MNSEKQSIIFLSTSKFPVMKIALINETIKPLCLQTKYHQSVETSLSLKGDEYMLIGRLPK